MSSGLWAQWFGCSVDAAVSCGVNHGVFDCFGELWSGGRVDVGFLRKVTMCWMRSLDRNLGGVSPGWL